MVYGIPAVYVYHQYIYSDDYITCCNHCGDLWMRRWPPFPGDVIVLLSKN